VPFRLADCADDAVAVVRRLDAGPAIFVGYSMGGAIAQLVARDHPEDASGIVLSGTSQHWQDPETRRYWRAMGALGLSLSVAPRATWRAGFRSIGLRPSPATAWFESELMRSSARDIAEAGRELGRYDSRPWLNRVSVRAAVLVTTRDTAVPPRNQRALAAALRAPVFEAPLDHLELIARAGEYNPRLLEAVAAVAEPGGVAEAPTTAATAVSPTTPEAAATGSDGSAAMEPAETPHQ
jgi:pimeloyl-ACP methyl ester carboxylesterase